MMSHIYVGIESQMSIKDALVRKQVPRQLIPSRVEDEIVPEQQLELMQNIGDQIVPPPCKRSGLIVVALEKNNIILYLCRKR